MTPTQHPYDEWIKELEKIAVPSAEWSRLCTAISQRALEELRKRDRAIEVMKNALIKYHKYHERNILIGDAVLALQKIEEVLK